MGDRLSWRQYQTPGSRGGVNVVTTNGNYTAWQETDQDGQVCNDDGVTGQWHNRSIDLSRLQGLPLGALALSGDQGSSGHWSIDFADMAVVSTDGTVTTWYNGQDVTPSQIGGPGTQNPSSAFLTTPEPNLPGSTLFYVTDHLGSAAMEFAAGGWPISSTQYAPFGAELPSNTFTANHYKFTGKERDAESGNDYFGARYYASTMGRWMSPDWASGADPLPYADLTDPQTLNLYSYTQNNPLARRDPDGHASYQDCNGGTQQCWQGDYNGERDCSGSAGCLFWNAGANNGAGEWQANDPTPPPGDPTGDAFTGLTRMMLAHSWGDFNYGLRTMGGGYAKALVNGPMPAGVALAVGLPLVPLKPLHSGDLLEKNSNISEIRKMSTQEIKDSLAPGQPGSLKVKADGTVMDGNTRLRVLQERGVDTNSLPREPYVSEPIAPWEEPE